MPNISTASEARRERFYPLTNSEWKTHAKELKPAELVILYHLRTLCPFDGASVEVTVREIARDLELNASTVSRALKRLDELKFIDLELLSIRFRILPRGLSSDDKVLPTDNSVAPTQQDCVQATETIATQHPRSPRNTPKMEAAPSEDSGEQECTKTDHLKIDQKTVGTSTKKGQGGVGTGDLLSKVEQAGVNPNKTIQRTLGEMQRQLTPPAAAAAVENAISALREQQAKGAVKNPGGFLVAALRRNFTSNAAKKQAREVSAIPSDPPITPPSPPVATPQPPNFREVEQAIDQALLHGDRQFAFDRLKTLWDAGYSEEIEELCILRKREWKFRITLHGLEL